MLKPAGPTLTWWGGLLAAGSLWCPIQAWTPTTQVSIASEAARLVPPDLARQIQRRSRVFREGVLAPFQEPDPTQHFKHADGQGTLDRAVTLEVAAAIQAIQDHRPFDEMVQRLGRVTHFVADADDPLAATADADTPRYFADYLRYAESASPRFPLVFYGLEPSNRVTGVTPLVSG